MPRGHKHSEGVVCTKCNREFKSDEAIYPGKVYVHKGKVMCKDCLVDIGVMPETADPYSVYLKSITDLGKFGPGNIGT